MVGTTVVVLLTLCVVVLAFGFQGSRGIWQPDESYYVGVAITMLRNGDLLIPKVGEEGQEVFLEKPPMVYWGIIAGLKAFGHSEFAVRAFNGVCYFVTCLIVGTLGLSLFKDRVVAIGASLIYATMVIPFAAASYITPDTALTLWTTSAALCFWKGVEPTTRHVRIWQLVLCLVVGLGFLTKGPAVLIPCGGMFVFLLARKQVMRFFRTGWALVGLVIFVLVGLSWFVYVSAKVPGAAGYFFDNQIWGRLTSQKYRRNPGLAGALIYLPVIVLGALPWSLIWLEKLGHLRRMIFRRTWWSELLACPAELFLVCWFFVPLLILCLASSKLGLYALPVFPAIAIASAQLYRPNVLTVLENARHSVRSIVRPGILTALWVVALLGARLALSYYPTKNDTRLLWQQLSEHLPQGAYEIVTVDEQAYGLLFYGAMEVENVAMSDRPYPTFSVPERFGEELRDVGKDKHHFVFVFENQGDLAEGEKLMRESDIVCDKRPLPFQRSILIHRFQDSKM